jgi:N-formylglutamate deformylase
LNLPLLVSVPHAGRVVPDYLSRRFLLDDDDLAAETDFTANRLFSGLEPLVEAYRTIEIARVIVDVDRSEDDRSRDGVLKTHTRSEKLIWDGPIEDETVQRLIEAHYRPYHEDLSHFARQRNIVLGIDCHTRPDGPLVTLSNGKGTCSDDTINSLAECFARVFGQKPVIEHPERGGYLIRRHAKELQWVELQISEQGSLPIEAKAKAIRVALEIWSSRRKTRWR